MTMNATIGAQSPLGQDNDKNSISVTGQAVEKVAPDRSVWNVVFYERDDDPSLAYGRASLSSNEAVVSFKKLERATINTSGISVGPRKVRRNNEYVDEGYEAQVSVTVRVPLESAVDVVAKAVEHKANQIQGPGFLNSNLSEVEARLEVAAAEDARERAQRLAEALDCRLGDAIRIAPSGTGRNFGNVTSNVAYAQAVEVSGVPVEAAGQEVSSVVQVTFALI